MATTWRNVWITGASTGIGHELALQLARRGAVVAVSARSADKLAGLAALEPRIRPYPVDVTDPMAMTAVVQRIGADMGPIDLAILNAGVGAFAHASRYDAKLATDTMAVNYLGLVNALEPLIPPMIARGRGHIAIVASVAGYRGLPRGSAYGPTKAAANSLAQSLAIDLRPRGITVSVVNPGFIDTPMTAGSKMPMPFMLAVDDAARRIVRGLERGKAEIAFPWQMVAILKAARLLPLPAYLWLARRMAPAGRETGRQAGAGHT